MTPQQELIKEIEKLDLWADRGRKEKIISTIKEFLKGYNLVKKKDLLTEEEFGQIKEVIKVYRNNDEILKKLKRMRLEEIK